MCILFPSSCSLMASMLEMEKWSLHSMSRENWDQCWRDSRYNLAWRYPISAHTHTHCYIRSVCPHAPSVYIHTYFVRSACIHINMHTHTHTHPSYPPTHGHSIWIHTHIHTLHRPPQMQCVGCVGDKGSSCASGARGARKESETHLGTWNVLFATKMPSRSVPSVPCDCHMTQ